MSITKTTGARVTAMAFAIAVAATMTACSSDDSSTESADSTMTTGAMSTSAMTADPAAGLVGPGCADYAKQVPTGPGSVTGMSTEPVAVAASNNPLLTTLTSALSGKLNPDVNLVDTLNGGEFTVFAPVDDAFEKVDAATIDSLKTDAPGLTSLLTYHVVEGQAAPDKVVGEHKTVQGDTLEVTGSGDDLKVNGAGVICGGVKTANATVYLIDGVLMPPADDK
ncbi:fasciclin domain-containing protein [Gordonia sp. HY285]|uniref:fasciclin domain-containing protein n=1 Tax=Gordonia liuliyuniae TaxID=2911517 RepID=UPI001F20804D|nr:fasciclin domain-containing protein [Gordonia liuliyuniae]MCF8612085.1 fasciclin domain-containing protein [Gordonia liuliyuniae]